MRLDRNVLSKMAVGMGLIAAMVCATPALAGDTLERVKQQGYVAIGYANEAPFSYKDLSGAVVGVDVEVLQALLKRMGIPEIRASFTNFGSLIPGLKAKHFDVVAAAMYITPERCKQVAFTEPMYILGDTIVVPKGNPKQVHSYEDVAKDPTFRLGTAIGGSGVNEKAKALGVQDSQLVGFNDNPSGLEAIKAGRIDGFAATALIAEAQLAALGDGSLERAEPFKQPVIDGKVQYGIPGFALRPEDSDFVAALNKEFESFRTAPEYLAILAKYGITKSDLPNGETVAKICGS